MSLFPFFQWLQQTDFGTALRESALVYPTVMATHLTGMALFGGLIFMTDLRILGLAMRGTSVSDVVSQFRPWKRLGLVLVATCLAEVAVVWFVQRPILWVGLIAGSLPLSMLVFVAFPILREERRKSGTDGLGPK